MILSTGRVESTVEIVASTTNVATSMYKYGRYQCQHDAYVHTSTVQSYYTCHTNSLYQVVGLRRNHPNGDRNVDNSFGITWFLNLAFSLQMASKSEDQLFQFLFPFCRELDGGLLGTQKFLQ
jgi:hypothetical protein